MNLIMSDKPLNIILKDENNSKYFDLSSLKIANCLGCFGCWVKTPGKCVIRDDATKVYPNIASAEKLIYVSKIKFGGYDSIMKTMLERSIATQQAFIRILNGEAHHIQREVVPKKAVIIAYGDTLQEEQAIFKELVFRNSYNMNIESYKVLFVKEDKLDETVLSEVEKWGN